MSIEANNHTGRANGKRIRERRVYGLCLKRSWRVPAPMVCAVQGKMGYWPSGRS